jgi:preprotein translocase subunit Sec61beta
MANEGINVPSGFGGLVKFKEEYESNFNLKPMHVVIFVIAIVVLRIALPFLIK